MGEKGGVYRVLEGKPERNRQIQTPRHRWKDNIKINLQDMGWGGMDWIDVAQDTDRWQAIVNAVMNLRVPQNVGNFLTS
jgi:hypothetical protein